MQVIEVPIGELIHDPNNARTHDEKNLSAIKGSLAKFDQQKPIVIDDKNVVIAGNGTLDAAKALGWQKIKCVRTQLTTNTDKVAFALADNRTSELAGWDDEVLGKELQSLQEDGFEIEDIGFDPGDFDLDKDAGGGGLTDEDEVPETNENEFGVQRGDIWQLGGHRVMCGDSTDSQDVDRLMDGVKADMVFTDPPYGGNSGGLKAYTGEERKARQKEGKSLVYQDKTIENDKSIEWILDCFKKIPVSENSSQLVFFKWDCFELIKKAGQCWGEPSALLVWDRVKKASAFFRFQPQHELCFHWGNQSDKRAQSSLSNVFHIEKDEREIHPTVKPIGLLQPIIEVCSSNKELVVDPFLGSGSTLIACEKTNRKCFGMEIDPHYCSVIIKRWQDFTGKTATKL